MQTPRVTGDPFALMINPQSVVQAMEASERLRGLRRRVCRPLDKVAGASERAEDHDGGGWDDAAASGDADTTAPV